jgi:hypothetical protein
MFAGLELKSLCRSGWPGIQNFSNQKKKKKKKIKFYKQNKTGWVWWDMTLITEVGGSLNLRPA